MNLFDTLVTEALKNNPQWSPLRMVIEKELLHHDILKILSANDLLKNLVFIGGTCLRHCYGGVRLSEDLDFTGGADFSRSDLSAMGQILTANLQEKYGLKVVVSEPVKDKKNVDTWKIKIETRPESKHVPAQRIHIDICAIPSYEKRPMMLLNPYGVDMGTSGLIIQVESREEIYADKIIAFALRANRIKYRDLWDIVWLHGQGVKPRLALINDKLKDRHKTKHDFLELFSERKKLLKEPAIATEFQAEMRRFLSVEQVDQMLKQENFWDFMVYLIDDLDNQMRSY
jgi:predicted nucleotidyltransferase component of viral defense system